MSSTNARFIVVVRTAGERTFEACRALVVREVIEDRLCVVDERPFEAALRRCYQIGINSDAEWMITLDADVLLREGAVQGLLGEAAKMPLDHFQIEGRVFDKLTNRTRWAGYRCYRTKYLREAENLIPADRAEIRPEFTTLERMAARGRPYLRSSRVYGIHDFEQHYADIYRKAFVHAEKHQIWLFEMLSHWKSQAAQDLDFRIALRGAADCLISTEPPRIDRRDFDAKAEQALRELGLEEKPGVISAEIDASMVERVLASASPSGGHPPLTANMARVQRFTARYARLGTLRFLLHFVGSGLCDMGRAMIRRAEKDQS